MVIIGVVSARIIEVRFYSSGKVIRVNKYIGNTVRKGDILASLDRKLLQAILDKQLSDYEKTRADFEVIAAKYPDPTEGIEKHLKAEKQSALNSSVKDVEISKMNLDLCDLYSPVDGVILDDNGIVAGVNITPASASFKIIDSSSYFLKCQISQKDVMLFRGPREVKVTIEGLTGEIVSKALLPYSDGKNIYINIPLSSSSDLLLGMVGQTEI